MLLSTTLLMSGLTTLAQGHYRWNIFKIMCALYLFFHFFPIQ
jgi:xanthine/uracil permease